jgi:hypothetical protein
MLPESVECMGEHVFGSCIMLEKVSISSRLKIIPSRCFTRCETLRSVLLPEGVESIRAEAFDRCTALLSLSLPVSLSEIDPTAFPDSRKLVLHVRQGSYALDYARDADFEYSVI